MSFGCSIGDVIALVQLASKVLSGGRKACGAYDGLTREMNSLHIALRQLERETSKPKSILNSSTEHKAELATVMKHCRKVLKVLDGILKKYNGLSDKKKKATNFWMKVQFGNGEMQDLSKIRLESSTHTNDITIFLNLSTVGSLGRVEEHMTGHSEKLRAVRRSVNWVTASIQAGEGHKEGSILTTYANDDKAFWKNFRRGLFKDEFSSAVVKKHEKHIRAFVKELGDRRAFDELSLEDMDSSTDDNTSKTIERDLEADKCSRIPEQTQQIPQVNTIQTPAQQESAKMEGDAAVNLSEDNNKKNNEFSDAKTDRNIFDNPDSLIPDFLFGQTSNNMEPDGK